MGRWLTLRAIGLGLVALVLMAAMAVLGLWQLRAYDGHQSDAVQALLHSRPVPLDDLLGPDAPFPADGVGRPVLVSGRYREPDQFYVRGLPGAGAAYAVVTPMLTTADSAILVVRGASSSLAASAPSGPVTVRGVLQPSQPTGAPLNHTRVTDGIRIASVLRAVHTDLYAGYVVLRSSTPHERLMAVHPPLSQSSGWAGVRNLLYAIQWWVFAGFVAFMWWRIVGDDNRDGSATQAVGYGQSP